MAVEGSILNKESIKKIMIEQYGISVEAIKKINRGSANVFEIFSKGSHYILKEFQSKIDIDKIKIEYTVVEHLRRDGVATPKYILNKNGELYFEFNKRLLIVQKFIEGQVVDSNTSNQEQIIESACVYGKIIKSLENFKYELPDFKRHYMSKELCEQDIKNIEQLIKINKNKDVNDALLHKREILLKLKDLDYTWQNKLTYKKSHGDYTVAQFIYNDKENIKAIVDWVSARKIPVARELIRNYFFMAKEIKKQNVNFEFFLEYIKEFEKYQELNDYDLKYMPLLYLIELSRTIYGYEQYVYNNLVEYLDFGNELYNQCLCIEKNSDELSRELLKLKNVNKMKGMKNMNYSNECPFCTETRYINNKLANLPAEEAILFENDDIYVRVDISPLCLGHILIITNKHYLNFFEIPKEMKIQVSKLKEKIKEVYKEIYNSDVLFFEHGSAQSGYAGASIDHAHLHCIPYKFDLTESLNRELGQAEECDILSPEKHFNNEFSYIYIGSEKNGNKIYRVEKLPSQFLRRLVFEKQESQEYKWQEKCITLDSVKDSKQTIEDLKDKILIE